MEETNTDYNYQKRKYSYILILVGIILTASVAVVSILRDRIVNVDKHQVTVYGEGKVEYKPDTAEVTLGMSVDKAPNAQDALNQMNQKVAKIMDAVKGLGIKEEDIKTQNYNLYPAYDYTDGKSIPAGYNANENLIIKVKEIDKNSDLVGKVISAASVAGSNQMQGVNYTISDPNGLRQKARIAAINDAKNKANELFAAAGVKPGRVISWTENNANDNNPQPVYDRAVPLGAGSKEVAPAQVPSGTQEITIGVGVNYEVR